MAKNLARLYLRKRGEVWHLKFPIPRTIRHLYPSRNGKPTSHMEVSLGTRDLNEANRAKHRHIAQWVADFNAKRRHAAGELPADIRDAAGWRDMIRTAADEDADLMESLAIDRATEIARAAGFREHDDGEHGEEHDLTHPGYLKAKAWYKLATTRKDTLREAWAKWMEQNEHSTGTKLKDEQAFRALMDFLGVADIIPTEVTGERALAYERHLNTEARSARGGPLAWATKDARIAPLRIFWREYLERQHIVPAGSNPWRGLRLTGRRKSREEQEDAKRPYTDEEILKLVKGPEIREGRNVRYPKSTLMELYALGFYTGARIGELANRVLGDVEKIKGGYRLHIHGTGSKTDAGERAIPILHPIPVAILKRRIGRRTGPKVQLFAEFIPGGPEGSLGWYPSKALGYYRDKVGLTTAVDTHSTRRQLISLLINKGHSQPLVQFYVGHKPPGVTAGIYAKANEKGLRSIAQAIRYPANIERAFRSAFGIT